MPDPKYQNMNIRGTPVRVLRAGKGTPLFLLRGDDASEGWRDYMEALSRSFDVIAPEHPGFGNTAKPEWLDGVQDMANFYLDMIEALDLDEVRLVGLGLGGWIAADMAIRARDRVESLTLVAAPGLKVAGSEGIDLFLVGEEQGIAARFADQSKVQAELDYKLTPETEDTRIANQMVIAQLAWSPRWHDPDLRKWAHRIKLPTLVVWGEKDAIVPVAHAHEWTNLIPGARLEIIGECGHVPYIERPDEFMKAVASFLTEERIVA
jgi:pimeloyl-ACP methyl ester carboxylesterase